MTAIRVSRAPARRARRRARRYDASEAIQYVLNGTGAIAAGIPYDEECMPLHIESADILRVTAATNNHVIVTINRGNRNAENK